MTAPTGAVTVLRGTRAQRRRLSAHLVHDPARARGELVVRHVTVSPSEVAARRFDAMRRAVAGPVDLVLVDHVTGGLDERERRYLLGRLRELARPGVAVVVDDRDPLAAMAFADHVLFLDARDTPVLQSLARAVPPAPPAPPAPNPPSTPAPPEAPAPPAPPRHHT